MSEVVISEKHEREVRWNHYKFEKRTLMTSEIKMLRHSLIILIRL